MPARPLSAALRGACLLLLAATAEGGAQAASRLDAGYAYVRFTGFQGSGALTIVPTVHVDRPAMLARGVASFSRFESGRWSASGSGAASAFSPRFHGVRAELATSGNATAYRASRTAQLMAQVRAHVHGDSTGGWLGAGTGTALYADVWQPNTLLEAGAWGRLRNVLATVSLSSAVYSFRDSTGLLLPDDSGGFDTTYVHRVITGYLTDATGALAWSHGRFDLDVTAGMRPIARYGGDREWVSASVAVWLRPDVAIIGTLGRQPENPLQNLSGLRYASVALRIGNRMRTRHTVPLAERAVATEFAIVDAGGEVRTVYIRATGARRVEIAAGFTGWEPRALTRLASNLWVLTLPVAAGTHDVSVRIDGGPWGPPPGLPSFDDEFGGRVGRLVIPPRLTGIDS